MDEKLRAQLVALGMDAKATDEEAVRFLEELVQQRAAAGNEEPKKTQKPDGAAAGNGNRADTGKPAGAGQVADAEALRQAGAVAERERVSGIRKLCERFATPELERTLVDEGRTVEDAQRLVYETALLRQATPGGSVRVTQDEHDKVRAAGCDALLLRAGRKVEKPADGADDLAGRSLPELARLCLERAGVSTRGMSRAQIVEAALRGRAGEMSTGDFTEIIAAGLRTSLREGWALAEETWEEWTDGSGRVDDLETHKAIDTSEFDDLDEVGELEEYKYGYITEGAEEFAVFKYGKLAGASMELILADQIDAILGLPARMGEACRRKGGDVVYSVLTANAAMGDTVALFHASSHGNLAAGGDLGAPSVATLDAAELAMVKQTGRRGLSSLQIRPRWLLAPWALKGATEVFFGSKFQDSGAYATALVNPWFGDKLRRIYEIRLDDDSVDAWYLAAARNTVRTYRLRGYETPQMSEHPEWKNDSITWKIRWFFGATAVDYRGLYKNPNT